MVTSTGCTQCGTRIQVSHSTLLLNFRTPCSCWTLLQRAAAGSYSGNTCCLELEERPPDNCQSRANSLLILLRQAAAESYRRSTCCPVLSRTTPTSRILPVRPLPPAPMAPAAMPPAPIPCWPPWCPVAPARRSL